MAKKVHVDAYTMKDGTHVPSHTRNHPKKK